jgi:hypothetical protein
MDFTARTGTPIYATGDGVVYKADASLSGYGNHIEINHGYGYKTLYAHLSKYKCRPGQRVKRGDIIGYVGSTGRSQAPHLHYEVLKNGERVNPLNFYYGSISAKEYIEISLQISEAIGLEFSRNYKFYVGETFSHCGVNSFQLFKDKEGWKIIYLIDTRRKDPCN